MPKQGPSTAEWTKRLCQYAAKEYTFTLGQHPSKNTRWGKEKDKVSYVYFTTIYKLIKFF